MTIETLEFIIKRLSYHGVDVSKGTISIPSLKHGYEWKYPKELELERKELLKLSILCQNIESICIEGKKVNDDQQLYDIENYNIHFLLFPLILEIKLIRFPINLIRHITVHKYQLKSLHIEHSPSDYCSTYLDGNNDKLEWNKLEYLNLSYNTIHELDPTLKLVPYCKHLELHHNKITKIANLERCIQLDTLNLSYNCIQTIENLNVLLGFIKVIDLSYNQIRSLEGFKKSYSIQVYIIHFKYIRFIIS